MRITSGGGRCTRASLVLESRPPAKFRHSQNHGRSPEPGPTFPHFRVFWPFLRFLRSFRPSCYPEGSGKEQRVLLFRFMYREASAKSYQLCGYPFYPRAGCRFVCLHQCGRFGSAHGFFCPARLPASPGCFRPADRNRPSHRDQSSRVGGCAGSASCLVTVDWALSCLSWSPLAVS